MQTTGSPLVGMGLLKLMLLICVSGGLCQRDCTGVDCPLLQSCIEEVLEVGACCASCVQTGCTCEGYQYYDCVNAGFQKGRVPEGESYFVDFGSTECSCPMGGGRISCHFIPCPDLPANCIEMSEPADGCIQCERIGCVYKEQKYHAGHSFHMDPCQVCHCPNDGGKLMCYPIPDCDPKKVHKPMLATTTEENPLGRLHKDPIRHIFNHQGSRGSISKPFPVSHRDNLPAFKVNPHKSHMNEEEEEEDYDYPTTDSLEPSMHDLVSPAGSSIISDSYPENVTAHQVFHRGTKQELKEGFGFHEATTDMPWFPLHKERTDEGKYTLHKGNPKKDILSIAKDEIRGAKFNIPDDSASKEKLPVFREMTYEEQFSIDRDTSERQSFSLYKDNANEEALEKSLTDSEGLAAPTGTTDAEMFDLYGDTTHSEGVTDFPVLVDLPTPELPKIETTTTWQTTRNTVSSLQNQSLTTEAREHYGTLIEEDITKEERNERTVMLSSVTDIHRNHGPGGMDGAQEENTVSDLDDKEITSTSPATSQKASKEHGTKPESYTVPFVRFSPTSQPALRVKADERQPPTKQSQSLLEEAGEEEREERENTLSFFPKAHEEPSDPALLERCCESGQKWASEHQHCNHLPTLTHHNSVCGALQEQCCAGTLRESRCLTGMNAAKAGEVCEESNSPLCGEDTQKECCSCCALGLRLRQEGIGCDVHQHLSYPCGHIFLTCCEEEEEGLSTPLLRRREKPKPTLLPKRVAERQFPKQPFSIEDSEHAANSVEKLEDVDECQRYEGQLCHHTCINTPGSYRCACHPGYLLLQDGHTCALENPEEENRVKEEDSSFTLATPPQETTTQITPLHNLCAGKGPCSQQCSVVRGKAQCSCFPGFSLKADGQNCEDFNECVTNTHTCLPNERCMNTVGAFVCEKQISCSSGYQLRNGVCEDIDECVLWSHTCAPGLQCQNTPGSFHCSPKQQRCLTGFTQDPHGNCIDVDECSALSEPCTLGFNCINTVGSYTCQRKIMTCSQGYHSSPDGARCVDVDECVMGTHRCGEGQVCHNTPGSFRCDCQTGYQYDSSRRTCVDVNECWRFPGRLCAQSCENTPGSYQCSCTTGFSLAFDGKNCEDLNECHNNPCSQECANIYGSYQCYCRLGYYLKEDGHTCEDIDECSQSIGNLCAFQCVNVPGSYQCACPPQGYSMSPNGRTCRDIDECATGVHNCSASQTCYNIQGSFRCLSFTCPENYRKVSDTRCERTSCPSFQNCQNMPLRITYYQLNFQTNIVIPAQIFRIGPSPAYSGDNIIISIPRGNEEGYFSTRRLNSFTGAVYLQRQIHGPRDFLIDVEMKLLRQGTFTTFLARIYVFITAHSM